MSASGREQTPSQRLLLQRANFSYSIVGQCFVHAHAPLLMPCFLLMLKSNANLRIQRRCNAVRRGVPAEKRSFRDQSQRCHWTTAFCKTVGKKLPEQRNLFRPASCLICTSVYYMEGGTNAYAWPVASAALTRRWSRRHGNTTAYHKEKVRRERCIAIFQPTSLHIALTQSAFSFCPAGALSG